jgi:hypothetical protein
MAIIDKPSDYFNTVLYTGNGGTNAITGVGFQPDWIWFKNRTSAQSHAIVDSVRGREGLQSNATDAEYTLNPGEDFGTFDSDGFTVLVPQQLNSFNYNTGSIVSWNWLANGTGVSNTSGSITSTVSANTTSGFSIVSYTGNRTPTADQSIGHGLGAVPSMMIVKNRSNGSRGWRVYHKSLGTPDKELILNSTAAVGTDTATWGNTTPTSSVFYVGASGETNNVGDSFIAYCFAEKKGFSKFGSYIGNGSTDGTFVYTGFKPAWLMIKKTNGTSNWTIWDSVRQSNEINKPLWGDLSSAESAQTTVKLDLLSNGFKIRGNGSNVGSSGGSYIYMAFAENPFVTSTAIPACAR